MFYPTKTKKITDNVYAVNNLIVNFFVYVSADNYICFDAGVSSVNSKKGIKKLGIDPDKISHVFLTHTDSDHAGGIDLFKNAKVYISKNEEQMINGNTSRGLFMKNNSLETKYYLLQDNEEMQIGKIKIKAIGTPGHTPGSMCYIVDGNVMFSGDTFSLRRNKLYPFNKLLNMDTVKQKETINKLANMKNDVTWIFTAHTGYSNDYKKLIKSWKY